MKKFIIQKSFFCKVENDSHTTSKGLHANEIRSHNQNKSLSVIKDHKLTADCLKELDEDIQLITSYNFQPLNSLQIYNIITKHITSLIQQQTSRECMVYFNDNKTYQSEKMNEFINKLPKRLNNNEHKMLESVRQYLDQKNNFENSSIRSSLSDFTDMDIIFRTILIQFLFVLSSHEVFNYSNQSKEILLGLLKHETKLTQHSILELCSKNSNGQALEDPSYISEFAHSAFKNILSIIFSQFNPTISQPSEDYYNACHIIKILKYLCEDHNKHFQKILLTDVYFQMRDNKKTIFYDMMLYVLDKIITLAGWEKEKCNEEEEGRDYFYGLFSSITEMLIEIVQGTDPENFNSLYQDEEIIRTPLVDQEIASTCEKGKALPLFLKNIKHLLLNCKVHSEIIYKIRKQLIDFILAFMEEYSCPLGIKQIIMSCYLPNKIIKSISTILKQYFLVTEQHDRNINIKTQPNLLFMPKINHIKLKLLKFNERLYTYFIHLYSSNNEFASTAEFQLCSALYQYFKLSLLQYKFEEYQNFWNEIKDLSPSDIDDFNARYDNELYQNEWKYEAYYVFALFEKITKSLLVKIPSSNKPIVVVYTMTPFLKYLSPHSKDEFWRQVNRSNRYSKLSELMEHTEYFRLEIDYNWKYLSNNTLLRIATKFNYYIITMIVFLYTVCLNITLLAVLHEQGINFVGENSLANVHIASYVFSGLDFFFILLWGYTKMPLYYRIEIAKYKGKHTLEKDLSFFEKIKISLRTVLNKREICSLIFMLIFILIGSARDDLTFLYPFALLSVISLSSTLSNIALSIVLKSRQLILTLIFTIIILYVWAAWGFFFTMDRYYDLERPVPEQTCSNLFYCWLTVMNQGLRWHAGIGKVLANESAYNALSSYVHRWFYDFIFFLLVIIIMLHIIFGIILDTFRELRRTQYENDNDIENICFICNLEKDECEKNNRNFRDHIEKEHNVWEYANYMITLRMRDIHDLNSINSYCKEQIISENISWIPDKANEEIEE